MKWILRVLLLVASAVATPSSPSDLQSRPWLNASLPINERVVQLLQKMSLEEKVAQTLHVWTVFNDDDIIKTYGKTGVGAAYIQTLSANHSCNLDNVCRTKSRNKVQLAVMAQSSHGIPVSFVCESLHNAYFYGPTAPQRRGRFNSGATCSEELAAACSDRSPAGCAACISSKAPSAFPGCDGKCTDVVPGAIERCEAICENKTVGVSLATIFPMPTNQGCAWSRSLVTELAGAIALESRAVGSDRGFSPEIQVATDPRFGRVQENFGADPFLVSEMAVAAVQGTQGPSTVSSPDAKGDNSQNETASATPGKGPNTYIDQQHLISEGKHFAAVRALFDNIRAPSTDCHASTASALLLLSRALLCW
jgi:beta-glucosidase-like glycosyl hydrolase